MTAKELKEALANVPDDDLKYISLLLLIPEILSGRITKEELLDEMVKLGLTEEEKNELSTTKRGDGGYGSTGK